MSLLLYCVHYQDFLVKTGAGLSLQVKTGVISLFHWGQDQTQDPRDAQGGEPALPRPLIFNPLVQ